MPDERLKVTRLSYDDLTENEKCGMPENGNGAEFASYLKATYDGRTILLMSDAMEKEDARFSRDVAWIPGIILMAYKLGFEDGGLQRLVINPKKLKEK